MHTESYPGHYLVTSVASASDRVGCKVQARPIARSAPALSMGRYVF